MWDIAVISGNCWGCGLKSPKDRSIFLSKFNLCIKGHKKFKSPIIRRVLELCQVEIQRWSKHVITTVAITSVRECRCTVFSWSLRSGRLVHLVKSHWLLGRSQFKSAVCYRRNFPSRKRGCRIQGISSYQHLVKFCLSLLVTTVSIHNCTRSRQTVCGVFSESGLGSVVGAY